MPLLRLVLAWLVLAALPLQGFAAASMLFCGQAAHGVAQPRTAPHQEGHDHAAHSQGAGHDSMAAAHAGHHESDAGPASTNLAAHGDAATAAGGDGHACPICASCCNLLAITEAPTLGVHSVAPLPPPREGPSPVITREASAPDKPPRA